MSYYLRVESVNLSYFIDDTNDLSTTRGGSLLLLEAMEKVEEIIENIIPKQAKLGVAEIAQLEKDLKILINANSTKTNKKKIKAKKSEIDSAKIKDTSPTITKGASWGLFNLDTSLEIACRIKKEVIDFFNTDLQYKHATIVVELHTNNNQYQKDRDSLQTLNHWQQMQAPSLAICNQGATSCAIDKVRPAPPDTEDRYLKDGTNDLISDSVYIRREYGKKQKKEFYKKIIREDKEFTNKKLENIKFTQDLGELSYSPDKGIMNGKIAYIYIDGNGFGDIQKRSKTPEEQKEFDQSTRKGREILFTDILKQIIDQDDWKTKKENEEGKIRIETLLWGGDEIIWIVPAWQGWWMINEFYNLSKTHITNKGRPLFHATGLVFCHHNAPIHRVKTLASNLAEFAKEANRKENLIAYQVLESFDHAGMQLKDYRNERVNKLGTWGHLLINADHIEEIRSAVTALKDDDDFAQRKIYQIVNAYKNCDEKSAQIYIDKLSDNSKPHIEQLKSLLGNENAHWLHLIDLWNYMNTEKIQRTT